MPDRILVPLDGSEPSWAAFEFALANHGDADIVVLNVINPMEGVYAADPLGGDYWDGWQENAEERAGRLFAEAEELAAESDVDLTTATEMGSPAQAIIDYAEEHDVDHVVMGSHGRKGVSRILLGSVAELVVRRAAIPVTIVR
jgi:nucleotide-binding universal stress UspA family protein